MPQEGLEVIRQNIRGFARDSQLVEYLDRQEALQRDDLERLEAAIASTRTRAQLIRMIQSEINRRELARGKRRKFAHVA